ncbi:MAG: sugar transferase [Clostridia bacterium]|nr:sugar transferase [Clostridia bacterium]
MEILKKFRKSIMFLLKAVIVLSLLVVFTYTWEKYYPDTYLNNGNYVIIFTYLLSFIAFTVLYGGFKIGVFRTTEIVYSMSLGAVFANVIVFGELCLVVRKVVSPLPILAVTCIDVLLIMLLAFISNKIYRSLFDTKKILAIYDGTKDNIETIRKIHSMRSRYRIEHAITIDKGLDAVKNEIDESDKVFIGDIDKELKGEIIKYAYIHQKRMYILPSIDEIIYSCSEIIQVRDCPIIYCRNNGLTIEQKILKRAMDLIVSSFALLIFSPVMLIISLAIKLYDGGPVFFKQKRITEGNREFDVLKFRSMVVNADEIAARKAVEDDDRITAVGKFIRPLRLDELPQLINILKGDMSLVGPRPERVENVIEYTEMIPEFPKRHMVKGGLTGYAQIYGKYNTSPKDKLNMDLIYIERYSLLMDIKLIILTLKILFMRESTEGFKESNSAVISIDDKK